MPEKTTEFISLWLDQRVVNIAHETFSFMLENFHMTGVIDHAAWTISEKDLLEGLSMLEPHVTAEHRAVNIEMSEYVHDNFVRLLDYAGFAAPERADRALLETVHEACRDYGFGKHQTYIVLAFSPEEHAAHNSVFQKMIDEPEAIDNSMYDLTEWDEFEALAAKLKRLADDSKSTVVVPMSFSEWATYSSYASHAFDLDDGDLTQDEEAAMSKVMSFNYVVLRRNARSEA